MIQAVQITDATFDAPHPNPEHVVGVTYDPVARVARIPLFKSGGLTAQVGDWILRGPEGDLWMCKPDIFVATYEPDE